MEKNKLAFIATSYIKKYDGVSVYTENLLQEIINLVNKKRKYLRIDVYVKKESLNLLKSRISIPENLDKGILNLNFIPVQGNNIIIRTFNLTKLLYKNGKYNLVYMANPMPVIFTPGPKIKTIHDFSFKIVPEYYSIVSKLYSDFLRKITIKFDDAIGYISESSKKDFEKFYNISEKDKRFIYLPNGIPFKIQKIERPSVLDIEKKFSDKNLKIVVVGRINRHKGFDRILEFVKYVDKNFNQNTFKSIQINIVGKKTKETESLIKDYKPQNIQLNFLGFLPDEELNQMYLNSHFCFFLSRNEGYGLPLIESLWMRTIPILSDIPIFREIMGKDYRFFSDETGYDKAIYEFIEEVFKDKEYRKKILNKIDKIIEKEKEGYKLAAKNLLDFMGYL